MKAATLTHIERSTAITNDSYSVHVTTSKPVTHRAFIGNETYLAWKIVIQII